MMTAYASFFSSRTSEKWRRTGLQRRAGVATPLFSIYSSKSTGIGEIPDLHLLVDWCVKTGLSIVQLLPMNDVGFNFTPYDAASTCALEPMYLSLENLAETDLEPFREKIKKIKERFPCPKPEGASIPRVDYNIKKAKLEILDEFFQKTGKGETFQRFADANRGWLEDYALFKVLKENFNQANWESWSEEFRKRDPSALSEVRKKCEGKIRFEKWLQWQLFEQFKKAKAYAASQNVLLMGDLPFLVSKDSADVWAHQDYFKLDRVAGAPPDAFFAKGQRWGMPPYDWDKIEAHGFDYLKERLRYAENFYDFFRVDHAVGTFRLWTIDLKEPLENAGLHGVFDPPEEPRWEDHGRRILSAMLQNTAMLPCAEDLGVVPSCSFQVLEEFAIPGMDVQRWTKDWDTTGDFKPPERYRKNSVSVISTHDTTSFGGWWEYEVGTVDGEMFERICLSKGIILDQQIKEKLFDLPNSLHGRLRWRPEVSESRLLGAILGRPEWEIHDLIMLHQGSYDEKKKFAHSLGLEGDLPQKMSVKLLSAALRKAGETSSIFSIQLLQDWLGFAGLIPDDPWQFRINFPGTTGDQNWTLVMPLSLEAINTLPENSEIRKLNEAAGRGRLTGNLEEI